MQRQEIKLFRFCLLFVNLRNFLTFKIDNFEFSNCKYITRLVTNLLLIIVEIEYKNA